MATKYMGFSVTLYSARVSKTPTMQNNNPHLNTCLHTRIQNMNLRSHPPPPPTGGGITNLLTSCSMAVERQYSIFLKH